MTDATLTDLAPFFRRYDRRNRLLLGTAFCASLILATAIATRMLSVELPGLKGVPVVWGMGVVFSPLFIALWWTFGEVMTRWRRKTLPPDGSQLAGEVDARNGMRIANAGFIFNIGVVTAIFSGQAVMALVAFRIHLGYSFGIWMAQATCIVVGAVTIYLGNLWPRMPVSHAPEKKPAATMKTNRHAGWFMVIVGLLVMAWGLFMPVIVPTVRPTQPPFEASKHREISLSPAALEKFVGRYDFGNGFTVSVTRVGPTLWVRREGSHGDTGAAVYPEAPDAFFWKAVEAQIRFSVDAKGTVTGAEFREAGPWQPGRRLQP